MNRYILCLGILISSFFTARAQYVSIPDTSFGNWLYANGYDSCLTGSSTSGWHLDTTCNKLPLAVAVDCSNKNIANLSGIQYFKHLRSLYCERNILTTIPVLPGLLTFINCGFNHITSLPTLPDSLVTLECTNNLLTSLPGLPAKITQINCSNNTLTTLPTLPAALQGLICANNSINLLPLLPASLLSMDCSFNQLTALPVGLPSVMINLLCENNQLTTLPPLPDSLRFFNCSNNLLPNINPIMPSQLITLDCSYNQLTSLGSLDMQLRTLSCEHNQLTFLPALTDTMTGLDCSYNNISSMSNLPFSLVDLNCSHNLTLTCLPIIYQSQLNSFYIDSTAIQCRPDSFTAFAFDRDPDSMTICTQGSGCPFVVNTGIAQLTNQTSINLYPNPNNGSFTLTTSGSGDYTITDMMGNVITLGPITSSTQQIAIPSAVDGVYMLLVKDAKPIRFVVMR